MSVSRHHAECLLLVETSGPFLSMPVLKALYINVGSGAIKLDNTYATESAASAGSGKRYTWNRVQVSAREPREIFVHVRAVSVCIGVLDRMVRIL